jgi:hypothetical protein
MSPTYSGLKSEPSKKPAWSLAYSLTLEMVVTCFSKMLVDWRYIPENRTLHSHCCENLKSNRFIFGGNVVSIVNNAMVGLLGPTKPAYIV